MMAQYRLLVEQSSGARLSRLSDAWQTHQQSMESMSATSLEPVGFGRISHSAEETPSGIAFSADTKLDSNLHSTMPAS
jgi:hypothetical protein